jgi:hypothetical protein
VPEKSRETVKNPCFSRFDGVLWIHGGGKWRLFTIMWSEVVEKLIR